MSRRFDIQAESAQSRWAKRRSSTPPGSVIASQLTGGSDQKTAESPATAAAETAPGGLFEVKRRASLLAHRRASSSPLTPGPLVNLVPTTPTPQPQTPPNPAMQAIKLQRKYPQVSQEEMFALIEKFK